MVHQITSKCELNILKATTNVTYVNDLAIRYRIPAVVCNPEYIPALLTHRAARGGGYKIICAIDFPDGKNFAMDKLKRTSSDLVLADGFEVLVSSGRTEIETQNELKAVFDFLKMQNRLLQIRWCLSMNHKEHELAVAALKAMSKFPPSYVRLDSHTSLPGLTAESQKTAIELVKKHVPFPIKASASSVEEIKALEDKVARFDVDIDTFKALVSSLDAQEGKVLNAPVSEESGPLGRLDGTRKAQAQRLISGGLKVQKKSRLRG